MFNLKQTRIPCATKERGLYISIAPDGYVLLANNLQKYTSYPLSYMLSNKMVHLLGCIKICQ